MSFFLAALGVGFAFGFIPAEGFLFHPAAGIQHGRLALCFVGDGALERAEAVQVFNLDARAQFAAAGRAQRNIGLKADDALFHVARIDAQRAQDGAQAFSVGARFFGRMHIRFGDDLQQSHAAAIEIDQ